MSVNKFIISKKSSNYTIIPNVVLQGLTNCAALGLYCYMVSLPHGWEFYKEHLKTHFGIGRNKLNELFKILEVHGLLKCVQIRTDSGHFSHTDVQVDDGTSFKIAASKENVQPCTGKPLTVNGSPVNSTYKSNIEKNNIKIKQKLLSASVDAQDRFEEFWKLYPVKKNKVRAAKIWKTKKCDAIADKILNDITTRSSKDTQWRDKQYIPHAATYLNNSRWEDEVTLQSIIGKPNETRSTVPVYVPSHNSTRRTGLSLVAKNAFDEMRAKGLIQGKGNL